MLAMEEVVKMHTRIELSEFPADEPVFILRAQDILASDVVLAWAAMAEARGTPADQVREARLCAAAMRAWPTKQVPGLPDTRVTVGGS